MPKIFISYRREDSQYQADRLHAALKKHVANPKRDIFIDVDNIPVGVDFVAHLDAQVAQCEVLLAVIGPGWLNAGGAQGRRLDDPKDFVRVEIASALKRGIPVAPILLDGVAMPREDQLPPDLKPLARRNAVEIRRQTFDADTERMIRALPLGQASRTKQVAKGGGGAGVVVALLVLAVVGGGTAVWFVDPFGWKGVRVAAADPSGGVDSSQTAPSQPEPGAAPPSAPSGSAPASADAAAATAEAAWGKIDQKDPDALRGFIAEYGGREKTKPDWVGLATLTLKGLDDQAWADALGKKTEASIGAYLKSFPADASPPGEHAKDAAAQIAAIRAANAAPTTKEAGDWAKVDKKDAAALRKFIATHADAAEAKTAEGVLKELDAKAWTAAATKGTGAAYGAYLKAFPPDASPPGEMAVEAGNRIVTLQAMASADSARGQATLADLKNRWQRAKALFDQNMMSKAAYDEASKAYWDAVAKAASDTGGNH